MTNEKTEGKNEERMNTENRLNNDNRVDNTGENFKEDNRDEREKEESSFRDKVYDVFRNITVEPCVLLFISLSTLSSMASQNLYLEKACRVNLNLSTKICDSLRLQDGTQDSIYERESQQEVTQIIAWTTYLAVIMPVICGIFVGSFSDKTGYRKFFMIIPLTGLIIMNINSIIHVYFLYETNLETLAFTDAIMEGFSGGWNICYLTAFSYISSITTERDRTFRLGVVSFCATVAMPIGTALSGILLQSLGFYGVYGISVSLNLINTLYVIFVLKDPKRSPQQKVHDSQGCRHMMRIFFDISNVKDTVNVIWRKTINNRRFRLCILLLVVTVLFIPLYGEMNIMYLSVRYRFRWDEVQFGIFQAYNLIINSVGTTLSVLVLAKCLGWHDSVLGILSCLTKIAASFIYGFAQTGTIFYLAPLVDIFNGTAVLAMRSILSKMVESDELGKINSIVGMIENLTPLIYVLMYLKVYSATMEVLPGTVFLLGAVLTLPAMVVLLYLFYEHRKQLEKESSQD